MKREDIIIQPAHHREHPILMALAKRHKCTADFGNHMFSGEAAYQKGWIIAAWDRAGVNRGDLLGFYCVRHKVRSPATSLYFIGVEERARRHNLGTILLEDLMARCPHPRIELNCRKDNEAALAFYLKHGFRIAGESLHSEGWALEKEWTT